MNKNFNRMKCFLLLGCCFLLTHYNYAQMQDDFKGKTIKDYASGVKAPVFITSSKDEHSQWKGIYNAVTAERNSFLPQDKGYHGSRALWPVHKENDSSWKAVKSFLMKLKK